MRSVPNLARLLSAVGLLVSAPQLAEAGLGCVDACGPAGPNGETCLSMAMGCNPFTNVCERCNGPAADDFCAPGGTCMEGLCINVMCGGATTDGGPGDLGPAVDAGTSSTATVADGGMPDGGLDAGGTMPPDDGGMFPPTATVADAGPIDTGVPPTDPNRNRSSGSADDKPIFDEGCGCSATPSGPGGAAALGIWLAFGALALQRRRASMGPTRKSAKSSV